VVELYHNVSKFYSHSDYIPFCRILNYVSFLVKFSGNNKFSISHSSHTYTTAAKNLRPSTSSTLIYRFRPLIPDTFGILSYMYVELELRFEDSTCRCFYIAADKKNLMRVDEQSPKLINVSINSASCFVLLSSHSCADILIIPKFQSLLTEKLNSLIKLNSFSRSRHSHRKTKLMISH